MKNIFTTLLVLFIAHSNNQLIAQTCVGATGLKHNPGIGQFVRTGINNQIIFGGIYYTSNQSSLTIDGNTVYPAPNDLVTVYAAVMDTGLNVIRLFNVIGFNNTGGTFNNFRMWDMHVDQHNQIYFCGSYIQDTLVAGNDSVYSDGYHEAFIVRCDSMGNVNLLKSCGTRTSGTPYVYEDRATSVTTDKQDNIYFTVNGEGSHFEINGDTINSTQYVGLNSYSDIFTVSLDANGQTRWLRNCGTPMRDDAAYDIAADSAGNVSLTGSIEGSNTIFYFGNFQHTYIYNQFGYHGFVARYNSLGQEQWLFPIEIYSPAGPDVGAYAVAVDEFGNTYSSGYFDGWAIFNGDTIRSPNYTSNYFVKYDVNGNKIFIKLGNIDTFYPYPITMDLKNGKVLIAGQTFTNQVTFGQYGLCCSYQEYAVLYDTSGYVIWLKGMREPGSTNANFYHCALDEDGSAYVCGSFSGGQIEIPPLTASTSSSADFFIAKFGDVPYNGLTLNIQNNGSDTITCGTSTQLVPVTNPPSGVQMTWWANNDTIPLPNFVVNLNATPKLNTLYIATAAFGGCVVEDSIFIAVNPISVIAGSDTTVCEGASWQLNGNTLFNASSYNWSPSADISNDTINNPVITPVQSQQLLYTINAYGCTNTDTMNIIVNPDPVAQFSYINNGLTISFTNSSTSVQNFIWLFDDGTEDSVNVNPVHVYPVNALYHPCLVVYNSCGADTVCDSINLTTVGLLQNAYENKIEIKETATEVLIYIPSQTLLSSINVFDINGRIIFSSTIKQDLNVIEKSKFKNGIYFLSCFSESETISHKFSVIH